jgi:hypothetical protein
MVVPKTNAFMISSSSTVLSFHDHDGDNNNYNSNGNDNDNKNNNNKSKANENTRDSSVVNSIREWVSNINVLNPANFYLFGLFDKTTTTTTTKTKTLSIVEISNMRVRDIKRRLAREHGYGADEIAKMIDKKELINALSYEEHRVYQKEVETKQRMALKKSIMVALVCVILVMFRPLLVHAWEVLVVNLQVYTDKKRYEWSRICDYRSFRAAWGFFLILCVDGLQLWLTMSVLASWIIPKTDQKWNSYLFPVPYIPIRPAALIASATTAANPYSSSGSGTGTAAGAGPLGQYGINIGPMLISWLFRYGTGKIEMYMGKALSEARRYKKKQEKIKKRGASSSSSSSSSKRKQQTKKKKSRDIHGGNEKVVPASTEGDPATAAAANDEATEAEAVQDNDNKRKNHTSATHTTTDTSTPTKAFQKDQQQPYTTTENANHNDVYGAMDELD